MKVRFEEPSEADKNEYVPGLLDDRIKITAIDDDGNTGYVFMRKDTRARLGDEYIKEHAAMTYSSFCEEWLLTISEDDYYNDLDRNPEKIIDLEYEGTEDGRGREIYVSPATGRHYLRESFYPREKFAKWYALGKTDIDDITRPNIIFKCAGQSEKVTYKDWNGVAAYSDTFNPDFWPLSA